MFTILLVLIVAAVGFGIFYLWRNQGPVVASSAAAALGTALWAAWGTVWDALMAFAALFGA